MKFSITVFFFIFFISSSFAQIIDSSRMVKLQGAINFRDIGNYKTNSGRTVKNGILFRSADLSKLTDNDLKIITGLNIQYNFDFRGPYEIKSSPDILPKNVESIQLSAGSETIGDSLYMKEMSKKMKDSSFILSFYNNISPFRDRYKPLFDSLLSFKGKKAIVFHCTAGKDRTGIAAALILYALGVDKKTILDDYEATNYYRKDANEKTINQLQKFYGIDLQSANNLMTANRAYLESTFKTIENQYGSVESYFDKIMGLNKNKIRSLRLYYTE